MLEKEEKKDARLDFMTEQETRMVDDFLTKIEYNRGQMGDYYDRWEKEQEVYAAEQELKDNSPNSRVNIINANIEGQVASLIEQNLSITCRGEGPSDRGFAKWAEVGLGWMLRKNRINRILERHERRRLLFGSACFKVYWDADAIGGFGLARITSTPLNALFVDLKVNDLLNLQDAEYIAEVMPKSKTWGIEQFGDRAESIHYGGSDRSSIFAKEHTEDDEDAFWYIQLWTKTDGKLRLIEFSDDGVLLDDSFKEWDGKKFKDKKDPQPFYRKNLYPYFITNLYYEEGKLLGFGDGKLLRPLQDMLNDLYDQIRRAARPNRVFFDPRSEVELEDLDSDDGPVPCIDPNQNIRIVEVGRVNPALWQLVSNVHSEVQRVTRFSELMMGQKSMTKTATEASIQQQQGSSAVDHKKRMLEETLVEVCEYALDLMMEKYTEGRIFRIEEDKDNYDWIDFRQMNEVPVMIPANAGYTESFRQQNPDSEMPKWMQLTDEKGENMTKRVDLDIEISVGAGLPKNKVFLYQMAERLAQAVIEGKNVISWLEFRKFIRDYLGIPIDDTTQISPAQTPPTPAVPQVPQQGADVVGLSPQNQPMLSNLPRRVS